MLEGQSELSNVVPLKAPKFASGYGALALEHKLCFPRVSLRLLPLHVCWILCRVGGGGAVSGVVRRDELKA